MKKIASMVLVAVFSTTSLYAQTDVVEGVQQEQAVQVQEEGKVLESESIENYRRSSLYSVLVKHSDAKYGNVIDSVFMVMPTPDKFNNHDLCVKSFESTAKNKKVAENKRGTSKDPNVSATATFMQDNDVARALVSKWFNRDASNGAFDMELIKERAYYDASASAIQEADASAAGRAILVDAGPDLIGKTFMLVNDITFVDKGEQSAKAATGLKMFGAIAGGLLGMDISSLTDTVADAVNEIDGFKVNVITYLYRLKWNEEIANSLYELYWVDASAPDAEKKAAYEQSDIFQMEYVGHSFASGGVTTSKTFSKRSHGEQMAVACTRAIDKAIVNLQRAYDEFKVNTPIFAVNQDAKQVEVKIGLKEGVNSKSRYEVLMVDESKGYREYKRVGMLKPVADKIWDNRFGALEEAEVLKQAEAAGEKVKKSEEGTEESGNVYLTSTTFDILEGAGKIYEGMLIREVRIK